MGSLRFPPPSISIFSFHQPNIELTIQVILHLTFRRSLWLLFLIQNVLGPPVTPGSHMQGRLDCTASHFFAFLSPQNAQSPEAFEWLMPTLSVAYRP